MFKAKKFFCCDTKTVFNINFEGTDIRNKKYFLKGWTSYLMSNHVITFSILNLPREMTSKVMYDLFLHRYQSILPDPICSFRH